MFWILLSIVVTQVRSCEEGVEFLVQNQNNEQCATCNEFDPYCSQCQDFKGCTKCVLDQAVLQLNQSNGYYYCHFPCKDQTYNGISCPQFEEGQIIMCTDGYVWQNQKCVPCSQGCKDCKSTSICTQCFTGYKLNGTICKVSDCQPTIKWTNPITQVYTFQESSLLFTIDYNCQDPLTLVELPSQNQLQQWKIDIDPYELPEGQQKLSVQMEINGQQTIVDYQLEVLNLPPVCIIAGGTTRIVSLKDTIVIDGSLSRDLGKKSLTYI